MIFQQHWLDVTIECNLQMTNFLDIVFDLQTGRLVKVNNELLYFHKQSNHPSSITKQIPDIISKRLSNVTCDKECFDNTAPNHRTHSGFNKNIKSTPQPQKRKRSRSILWFNPPFSSNVKTNIDKKVLQLLDKHFPKHQEY